MRCVKQAFSSRAFLTSLLAIGGSGACKHESPNPSVANGDGIGSDGTGAESSGGIPGPSGPSKLDVPGDSTGPGVPGDCVDDGGMDGEVDFSNIWIANSPQGTVSKIDTRAAVELGRYLVTPNPSGNPKMGPSRTSVSLRGNMAVADRDGGLAKVWARQPDCQDRNGNGTIDTSNGATFLPWGEDECLAWHIDLPRMTDNERRGPRVVQWTAPADPTSCTTASEDVWTVFCNENDDDATAWLVNGSDGSIKVEIPIEGYECDTYGPYGGAADANNDLWFVDRDSKQSLFRVQYDCTPDPANGVLCWEEFPRPEEDINGYGITVDGEGRVWLAGTENALSYYWPEKNEWRNFKAELDAFFATLAPPQASPENILRGLMMDENGLLWIATIQVFNSGGDTPGLLMVDTNHDPPALEYFGPPTFNDYMQVPAGISIDVDGYVWLVDTAGEQAFKIDPNDPANYERVTGLELPYTYSDMTGFGLKTVVGTPVG